MNTRQPSSNPTASGAKPASARSTAGLTSSNDMAAIRLPAPKDMTADITVLDGLAAMPMSAPIGSDIELRAPKNRAAKAGERMKPMDASRVARLGATDLEIEYSRPPLRAKVRRYEA